MATRARDELEINALGGDDRVDASALHADALKLAADGGTGDDTILGGAGADLLTGGDGNDFVDGNQGADTVLLGAGDDRFAWDPGDGSDVVEGQAGRDAMTFNGANVAEQFDVSANGQPGAIHARRRRNRHGPERCRGDRPQRTRRG